MKKESSMITKFTKKPTSVPVIYLAFILGFLAFEVETAFAKEDEIIRAVPIFDNL